MELPKSFVSLLQCEICSIEMNPLQSPPLELFNEGMINVMKYCSIRSLRLGEIEAGLLAAGMCDEMK